MNQTRSTFRTLRLTRECIRVLSSKDLRGVVGGELTPHSRKTHLAVFVTTVRANGDTGCD
jgi:hypothetical protein